MILPDDYYARQISLPEFGTQGQDRLRASRVLVVGAGGLGSPVLMALAGAGVGHLTIIDSDTVAASNLNRQFLYTAMDIGQPKARLAQLRLQAYHPDLAIDSLETSLDEPRARELFGSYDLIVAAVDNLETRRMINRVCYATSKPWIDGGVRGFSGYVTAFLPGVTPCYDCCFDLGPQDQGLADQERADSNRQPGAGPESASGAGPGAIGVTASVIGSLEADLALIHLLGLNLPLTGEILYYHGRTLDFMRLAFEKRADCPICGGT